jgi:hypothetical protein
MSSYQDLWMALVVYSLGDDRHARLRPDLAERKKHDEKELLLTWSRFRSELFPQLAAEQREDGSWDSSMGPVFDTSLRLIVLQLERDQVPWFRR